MFLAYYSINLFETNCRVWAKSATIIDLSWGSLFLFGTQNAIILFDLKCHNFRFRDALALLDELSSGQSISSLSLCQKRNQNKTKQNNAQANRHAYPHTRIFPFFFGPLFLKIKRAIQPNQTKQNQTKPHQTKPNQTKPNQTKQPNKSCLNPFSTATFFTNYLELVQHFFFQY